MADEAETAPRGRHAPPLEVRQDRQRSRLFAAAAAVFARNGYADATAESIAREAGMSKATFYEHFGNKEECILALFDAAIDMIVEGMAQAARLHRDDAPRDRVGGAIHVFLEIVAAFPDQAQTLLVEIIGAGPQAMERRDAALARVAEYIDEANQADAAAGNVTRLASPYDAFAIVGAIVELASRQLRTHDPEDIRELEPVIERLILAMVGAGPPRASAA
jgi:AcrR family transcriptional regulator